MTDTATLIGPVVRMCEDEACHGCNDCPSATADRARLKDRTVAMTERAQAWMASEPDAVCALLAQELVVGACASDSRGVRRIIPDGCQFRVHRGTLPGADLTDMGGEFYVALYSGPAACIDGILGDAPEWPAEEDYQAVVLDRFRAMRNSGALDALNRLSERMTAENAAAREAIMAAEKRALRLHA